MLSLRASQWLIPLGLTSYLINLLKTSYNNLDRPCLLYCRNKEKFTPIPQINQKLIPPPPDMQPNPRNHEFLPKTKINSLGLRMGILHICYIKPTSILSIIKHMRTTSYHWQHYTLMGLHLTGSSGWRLIIKLDHGMNSLFKYT